MVYTLGLAKHTNIRYRDSANRLSRCELVSMLRALSLNCEVSLESLGGADFLTFESHPLSEDELSFLFRHSAVRFMAESMRISSCPFLFPKEIIWRKICRRF